MPLESSLIVSVRPTKDGRWEAVETTKAEDAAWLRRWARWWDEFGEELKRENPDWWKEN